MSGLGLIAVLAILLVPALHSYSTADTGGDAIVTPPAPATSDAVAPTTKTPAAKHRTAVTARRAVLRVGVPQASAAAPVASALSTRAPATAAPPRLVLTAARGDCWISVRRDSSAGAELYTGTLVRGNSLSFPLGKIWVRIGAPQNLEAKVGGRKATIPTSSFNVLVTRSGVTAAPDA